ncbi:hypothetical protein DCO58_03290 [Helicobacter saguini]|uniref:Uncharacterized protein n=3 Tax=Helicobacter saguini TaxID=1548018 RepID=A0A4U8T5T6_9HELI|nr:hypothetical protein [Helicobacter saguini]MWV66723.1 hypothetical protein [Helicobacter saguini]TLD94007.1 hypothetical protein LS64_007560 [Helicobacter saguini]
MQGLKDGFKKEKVVIFGAGNCGRLIASQIALDSKIEIVAFIDNDKNKEGSFIQIDSIESNSLRAGRVGIDKIDSIESKFSKGRQEGDRSLDSIESNKKTHISPTFNMKDKIDSINNGLDISLSFNKVDGDSSIAIESSQTTTHRPFSKIDSNNTHNIRGGGG